MCTLKQSRAEGISATEARREKSGSPQQEDELCCQETVASAQESHSTLKGAVKGLNASHGETLNVLFW